MAFNASGMKIKMGNAVFGERGGATKQLPATSQLREKEEAYANIRLRAQYSPADDDACFCLLCRRTRHELRTLCISSGEREMKEGMHQETQLGHQPRK